MSILIIPALDKSSESHQHPLCPALK